MQRGSSGQGKKLRWKETEDLIYLQVNAIKHRDQDCGYVTINSYKFEEIFQKFQDSTTFIRFINIGNHEAMLIYIA